MRHTAIDVARSVVCVYVCVCALGIRVSCAKTPEPIEMPFGDVSCGSKVSHIRWGADAVLRE